MINLTNKTAWELSGKKAIVTGASQGIGLAIADVLLQFGAQVFTVSRTPSQALDDKSQIWQQQNFIYENLFYDVSKVDAIAELKQNFQYEHLDILVNTIGITVKKRTELLVEEEFYASINAHMLSTLFACQTLYPLLKGGGAIVNLTSINAYRATPNNVLDGMVRSATKQLTRSLAKEWAKDNIRVNSVAPGTTNTPRLIRAVEALAKEDVNALKNEIALGRFAEADEIANVVCFLTLPAASFITGQDILVDGGQLL